jgi:hypothetical protein
VGPVTLVRVSRATLLFAPFALLLSLACQSVPPAPEGVTADQVSTSSDTSTSVERMLALSVSGQTLGVVTSRLDKHPDGTWTVSEFVTVSLIREGGGPDAQFSSTTESMTTYGANHEFISDVTIEREAGVTITRSLALEGNELVSTYSGPGRPEQTKRFEVPADYRSSLAVDMELVQVWQSTGQPATRNFSNFDADRERFEKVEVTILGATEFKHGDTVIPAYEFETKEEDGTVVRSIVDHDIMALSVDASGAFIATLVDQPPVLGESGGGRINSELPVAGRTTNRWWELAEQKVTVQVEGDNPEGSPLWEDNHYHQVEREGTTYAMTLRSTLPAAGFVSPSLPMKIDDAEVKRFLQPTDMAQSDDPSVVKEAKRIVGSETNAMIAAQKIVNAVFESIDKQAGVRGSATALEVLQNGAGDCTEHAVLVVALMRAAGIPARTVDGIVLAADGGGNGVAGYHAWAEIWLGQWIGVDATVDETGTSARYLEFGIDEPGSIGSGGKMMRSIGKTKIELGPHLTYEELR